MTYIFFYGSLRKSGVNNGLITDDKRLVYKGTAITKKLYSLIGLTSRAYPYACTHVFTGFPQVQIVGDLYKIVDGSDDFLGQMDTFEGGYVRTPICVCVRDDIEVIADMYMLTDSDFIDAIASDLCKTEDTYHRFFYVDNGDWIKTLEDKKNSLPDLIAGGHQHPEMILFDPTLVEPIQEIPRATPGGGNIQDKPKKGKIPLSIALGLAKSSHDSVLSSKNFSESDKEYQRSYRPFDKIEEEYNITIPRIEGTRIPVDLDKFIESVEERDGIIDLNYPTPRIVHKKSSDIKIPFSLGVAYDSNNKPYITGVEKYNPDEQQNISTIAQINSTKSVRKHRKTRRRISR